MTATQPRAITPSANPLARYVRQTLVAPIGRAGQERIASAHVLVIGCGALGGASANLLARAGFGKITLADRDYVELHNLQRQTLFDEADVANHVPKAAAAADRLRQINSQIKVVPVVTDVNPDTIERLLAGVDIIVDGLDNFETRYLVNEAAVKHEIPWVYGGVIGTYGMTMTIRPHNSPCLRCIFPEAPGAGAAPTCDTAGVLGPAVDVVAGLQVAEAMKLATGAIESLNPGLLSIDVWAMAFDRIDLSTPIPGCPTCDAGNFEYLDGAEFNQSTSLCGHDAIQILARKSAALDLEELEARLSPSGETLRTRFLLRFRPLTSGHELTIFPDGRAIIKGTTDPIEARTLYARYIGT